MPCLFDVVLAVGGCLHCQSGVLHDASYRTNFSDIELHNRAVELHNQASGLHNVAVEVRNLAGGLHNRAVELHNRAGRNLNAHAIGYRSPE